MHAEVTINGLEQFDGVGPELLENVQAYLRLDREACDAPDWLVRRLFVEADKDISEALEAVGYYDVQVSKTLRFGESCWGASFNINVGPPVVLREVRLAIEGTDDEELNRALEECALQVGDTLNHGAYERCKRRIINLAEGRGFFDALFAERRVDVYPDEYAADVALRLESGRRYVFGATTFNQEVLDRDVVRRYLPAQRGDPYDVEILQRLQRDMAESAYFDQVVFTPSPRGEPHYDVPIYVELTPGKKWQYVAGVGFATDVGPKLRFGVLNRRVNSRGHQAEVEANLSRVISEIDLTYRVPLDRPRDWIAIDTGYRLEDNDSFDSRLFTAGIQRIQRRDSGWVRSLFLTLRLEEFETGVQDDGDSELLTPGISYSSITEDYPARPLAGHRSLGRLSGAVNGLISDTSFLQAYGNTKWVFSLWPGARLLTRGEIGFTAIDRFPDLPASVRFFAGGDTSVRGYDFNSLGPTDPFGAVVGGSNLLVGSIEVDQMVADNWAVAAFVDSGNAYDDIDDFDPATGVGAGIRWFSPLGPIRFDVAVPLESDAPDNYRIHVTIGPDL